jgi:hypothetical protein
MDVAGPDRMATVVLSCGGAEVATWAITGWDRRDLGIIDTLARLQLLVRRIDCRIEVRDPCPELARLLDFVGLAELLSGSVEMGGQPEDLEEPRVEEVVMPDDPIA